MNKIIGSAYDHYCFSCLTECDPNQMSRKGSYRRDYGRIIPVRVIVRKLPDSTIVLDKTFQTVCSILSGRDIGYIKLSRGEFSIEVINILSQPELKSIKTKIALTPGHGK
ncbi:MAG: hypothetical protein ABFD50_02865 [Smithella sp.]